MKKINSISLAVISVCAAAFMFSSCQKEIVKGVGDSRYVSFSASVETGMETKAQGSRMESVDLSEEGASLFVTSSVSVNRMTPFGSDVITKGSVVGSGFTSFNVNMVGVGSGVAGLDGDHYAVFTDSGKLEWPVHDGETPYTFIASYLEEGSAASFTGESTFVGPDGGSEADALAMSDLLLAKTAGVTHDEVTYHNPNSFVKLHFYHALAAVRFNIDGTEITRISINNVAKDGTVTTYDVAGNTNVDKFLDANQWVPGTEKVSYAQVYNSETPSVESRTFFIVPQQLEGITITFTVKTDDGGERQITANAAALGIKDSSDEKAMWKGGYVYNYTVSTSASAGNVEISVSEDSHVTNNKIGSAYVRAAVFAHWVDNSGRVVKPWIGTINANSTTWVKIGKYYYTKSPVYGYEDTEALIASLTADAAGNGDVAGLTLKVNMLAQAIAWDSTKANLMNAWGLTESEANQIDIK